MTTPTTADEPGLVPDEIRGPAQRRPTTPTPVPPDGLSAEEVQDLQQQAESMVSALEHSHGSAELEMITSLSNLGLSTQRHAGADLELLRGHLRRTLRADGGDDGLWRALLDMRVALARIDPHQLEERNGFRSRLARLLPLPRLGGVRVLERIAARHDTVSQEIDHIESRLHEAQTMLVHDNLELRQLYEQAEPQHLAVLRHAYVGELALQQLAELMDASNDPARRDRLESAVHALGTRVQDLRAMAEVQRQFFVGIEMTHENNVRLGQSVDRTLSLSAHVVTVGLAIQVAIDRQRRVRDATQRTRDFLAEMITANAAAIKQHTEEIGDVYNNPVIAIDKIVQAHQDLIEAIESADRIKRQGIATARENVARLEELTRGLPRPSLLEAEASSAEV